MGKANKELVQTDFNASGEPFLPIISSYLAYVPPAERPSVYQSWQLVQVLQNYTQLFRDTWNGCVKGAYTASKY